MKNDLIQEMEDILFEKIERQSKCLSFYETLDDDVRLDFCDVIFKGIDEELQEIGRLDLIFVSKLEKFKMENNILDLNELDRSIKFELEMVKKAVSKTLSLSDKINAYSDSMSLLRIKVKKESQENMKKMRMTSAYRNINKF